MKLEPCPKCGREPEPQRLTFYLFDGKNPIMRRYICRQCGISGAGCGDLTGAAEEWNRKAKEADE